MIDVSRALADANAHWAAGQTEPAERLCRLVLRDWPGQGDALHLLGLMALAWGNRDTAADYLRQACEAPRAPAAFHSNLAEVYRQQGRLAEAEAAARRAIDRDSDLVQAWNNLGIILQEAGKLEESQLSLARAVAMAPDSPQGHNNLGNTLMKLKRLEPARAHYAAAIQLDPNYAEAHSNLSVALGDLGEFEAALRSASLAVELDPRLADAYINAALIEGRLGRHEAQLRWLDGVLAFAPSHVAALVTRADALRQVERFDDALATTSMALAIAPEDGDVFNAHGLALAAVGRSDEALAAFDRAGGLSADPGVPLNNRATLLMELGRSGEALAALDHVVATRPDFATAWFNRVDLKTFAADDPDVPAMERLLASGGVRPHADRICLHFALGKACLDFDDGARAFAHLAEGNRLKRMTIAYDGAVTAAWMARIAEVFDADLIGAKAGAGALSEVPIFVIGMPRSGTSLVEQLLASHPGVHGAGELPWLRHAIGRAGVYPDGAADLDPSRLRAMASDYLARLTPEAPRAARIVDKLPSNFLYAGMIHLMLPNARIIHCRRDPIDTCLSCYAKLFRAEQPFAYDLEELGAFHRAYQRLMAHWRAVLPAGVMLEVDHEAVVADLETEARRLIDFCGLEWDERVLRYYETERAVRTASHRQVRQPIDPSRVGRGRRFADYLGPLSAALAEP